MLLCEEKSTKYEELSEENPAGGILLYKKKDDALVEIMLPKTMPHLW